MRAKAEADARGAPGYAVKIGLNSGPAVVGNVGAPKRYNYTAVGETVNIAARLESVPEDYGCRVVVGPKTAAAIADRFVLCELDWIKVKGKEEGFSVFQLVAEKSAASAAKSATRTNMARGWNATVPAILPLPKQLWLRPGATEHLCCKFAAARHGKAVHRAESGSAGGLGRGLRKDFEIDGRPLKQNPAVEKIGSAIYPGCSKPLVKESKAASQALRENKNMKAFKDGDDNRCRVGLFGGLRCAGRHDRSPDDQSQLLPAMLPVGGIAAAAGSAVSADDGGQHIGRRGGRRRARRAGERRRLARALIGAGVGALVAASSTYASTRAQEADDERRRMLIANDMSHDYGEVQRAVVAARQADNCYTYAYSQLNAGVRRGAISKPDAAQRFAEIDQGEHEVAAILAEYGKKTAAGVKQYEVAFNNEAQKLNTSPDALVAEGGPPPPSPSGRRAPGAAADATGFEQYAAARPELQPAQPAGQRDQSGAVDDRAHRHRPPQRHAGARRRCAILTPRRVRGCGRISRPPSPKLPDLRCCRGSACHR